MNKELEKYMSENLSEFRNNHDGKERWAQLLKVAPGEYEVQCFIDNVYQGARKIKGHSLSYAEDAAENFVFGIYDKP